MQVQGDDKPYDDINITPMLDLAYVLLVIFILMTTASVSGHHATLPKASRSSSPTKVKSKAIIINNEGKIKLNGQDVTLAELEQQLQTAKSENPDTPVAVRGDDLTQYQGVMDVIDVVNRVGLTHLGLATKPAGTK
jgi:biopolymer transport protein ExbD